MPDSDPVPSTDSASHFAWPRTSRQVRPDPTRPPAHPAAHQCNLLLHFLLCFLSGTPNTRDACITRTARPRHHGNFQLPSAHTTQDALCTNARIPQRYAVHIQMGSLHFRWTSLSSSSGALLFGFANGLSPVPSSHILYHPRCLTALRLCPAWFREPGSSNGQQHVGNCLCYQRATAEDRLTLGARFRLLPCTFC